MGSKKKCEILVFTWFYKGSPGYLVYSYRVRTLMSLYRTVVVSNQSKAYQELNIPKHKFVYMKGDRLDVWHTILYFIKVWLKIHKMKPDKVVLLSSYFAPVTSLIKRPTTLYWNEHPLHTYPDTKRSLFGVLKSIKNAIMRRLAYMSANRAKIVMPIGEHMEEDLKRNGCEKNHISLIYMGVDRSFVSSAKTGDISRISSGKPPRLDIIYTGTVSKDRGRDIMLEALSEVNKNLYKIRLTIVGADPFQMECCRKKAVQLGICDNLDIKGRVPGSEIPALLHNADIGICIWDNKPFWQFNPPTKLFEYLVAGLPVLASNIRTHTLYIKNWENGLIFDYNSHSLAQALNDLWDMRERLPSMRENAISWSKKYLWENINPQFISAIRSL